MSTEAEILTAHAAYSRAVANEKAARHQSDLAAKAANEAQEAVGKAVVDVAAKLKALTGLTASSEPAKVEAAKVETPAPPAKSVTTIKQLSKR